MKTQHCLMTLVGLTLLLFTSCDQSGVIERAEPADLTTKVHARDAEAISILSSIDLSINFPEGYSENGFPGNLGVSVTQVSQDQSFIPVEGKGEGSSDLLGSVFVRAQLRYYPATQRMAGTIDMNFKEIGSTLQIAVDGSGRLVELPAYGAMAIKMSTQVVEGTGELSEITLDARTYFFDAIPLVNMTESEYTAHLLTEGSVEF